MATSEWLTLRKYDLDGSITVELRKNWKATACLNLPFRKPWGKQLMCDHQAFGNLLITKGRKRNADTRSVFASLYGR